MNAHDGIVRKLYNNGLLNVEQEFVKDVHYEVITGSTAYGMNISDSSDTDVVGICIQPLDWIFPFSVGGYIYKFGTNPPTFDVAQQHHILHPSSGKQYDVTIYGIVKFFQLAAENNPNMCTILFHPERCITHIDNIGRLLKTNRKLFLTKHSFHKFSGYAASQGKKLRHRKPEGKRADDFDKFGYDLKNAAHLVRLMLEVDQILTESDLDIERNSEILKSIRRGEWELDRVESWFKTKEEALNILYAKSSLRHSPDWDGLRILLLTCLEEKYGSLSGAFNREVDTRIMRKYEQIRQIIQS